MLGKGRYEVGDSRLQWHLQGLSVATLPSVKMRTEDYILYSGLPPSYDRGGGVASPGSEFWAA